jgi:predicted TIM-barrel fold metal-dependent hydrolase
MANLPDWQTGRSWLSLPVMKIDPELQQAVDAIRVIDTHEHQEEESARLARKGFDFAWLFEQYASHDLVSAGMPDDHLQQLLKEDVPLDRKWTLFEPWYHASRNTAYIKAAEIAIRDLYGIDELNASTAVELTERMQSRNKPGIVKWILQSEAGIDLAQVNALDTTFFRKDTDRSVFMQDIGVVSLLGWPLPLKQLTEETGIEIKEFKHYVEAIDALFDSCAPMADAIKQQSAYFRAQRFEDVPDDDAARVFNEALKNPDRIDEQQQTVIQDWGFHHCVQQSIKHDLPIKIHTGYKAGCNYMDVEHIKPTKLTNVFLKYPDARFDLFHIGYPYQEEVLALAKHFRNVHVDMCWAWIIDWHASIRFFKQYLTAVPANKLFAFGGDYVIAEPAYGHLKLARRGIARALTELVEDDYFTKQQAIQVASMVLRENAIENFRIDKKRLTTPA